MGRAMQQLSNGTERLRSEKRVRPTAAAIETVLIDFVVEHNGFPRELVELDADLENALAIDASLKACMLREARERFGLGVADPAVALSERRLATLRDVIDLLTPSGEPAAGLSRPPAVGARLEPGPARDVEADRDSAVRQTAAPRVLLRAVDAPLPAGAPASPVFHGSALVLGRNPAADALRDRLVQLGATV
jgi:hypothetical protein